MCIRNNWIYRLVKEGNETVTNCNQLKLRAEDGKMRLTDVADTDPVFCPRVFWRKNRKKTGLCMPCFSL